MIPIFRRWNLGRSGNGELPADKTVIIPDEPDEVTDTTALLKSLQKEARKLCENTSRFAQDSETLECRQDAR